MNADITAQLKDFANERISHAERSLEYDKLKMSVIQTEVMLGEAERQYDPDDADYEGYLEALDGIWGGVCSMAVKRAVSLANDSREFSDDLNLDAYGIESALADNYLYGALAAVFSARKDNSVLKLPMLSAAAFNKNNYEGYKDEIACLRMLLWAGFDPNAKDSEGKTALHLMASLRVNPGSHPRAVRLLLDAGIDPNLKNKSGDTALCFMAGNTTWNNAHTKSAWLMLDGGADPLAEANDGECAYSLWKKNRKISEGVADIVTAIEAVMEKRRTV